MAEYSKSAVMTVGGRFFDPLNPRAEDVSLGDVAHALEAIPRFNGHTTRRISVAEHSLRVARIVQRMGGDALTVLMGLLHDAAEAYCGDIVRPLKTEHAKEVEAGVLAVILTRVATDAGWGVLGWSFPPEHDERWAMVRLADDIALFFEAMLWQPGAEVWAPAVVGELAQDLWAYLPDVAPRPDEVWLDEVRRTASEAGR